MSAQPVHDEPLVAIKTLTAEVKTITMNNRQVTLSVARQLDRVNFFKMEPWGRVCLPSATPGDSWNPFDVEGVMVIGASDGTLVTAQVPGVSVVQDRVLSVIGGHVYVCLSSAMASRPRPTFRVDGVTLAVDRERVISHYKIKGRRCDPPCVPTFSDDIALGVRMKIAAHKLNQERDINKIHAALALPKIVLAGLK